MNAFATIIYTSMFSFRWFNSIATNELSILAFHACVFVFTFQIEWQSGFFVVLIQRFTSRNRMRKRLTETVSIKSFRLKLNIWFFYRPYRVARIEGNNSKPFWRVWVFDFERQAEKWVFAWPKQKPTNANAEIEMFLLFDWMPNVQNNLHQISIFAFFALALPARLPVSLQLFKRLQCEISCLRNNKIVLFVRKRRKLFFLSFDCDWECLPQCISIFSTLRETRVANAYTHSSTHAHKRFQCRPCILLLFVCPLSLCLNTCSHLHNVSTGLLPLCLALAH